MFCQPWQGYDHWLQHVSMNIYRPGLGGAYGRSSRTILPFGCSWRYRSCGHCISNLALQRRYALCGRWACLYIISGCVGQAGSFGYLRYSCRAGVSMWNSNRLHFRTYRSILVFEVMILSVYTIVYSEDDGEMRCIVRVGLVIQKLTSSRGIETPITQC
jgi:hypothetical protein